MKKSLHFSPGALAAWAGAKTARPLADDVDLPLDLLLTFTVRLRPEQVASVSVPNARAA